MKWFAYLWLVTVSGLMLGSALRFYQAARGCAEVLCAAAKLANRGDMHSRSHVQQLLVPPNIWAWFWVGLVSTIASVGAGGVCLGWIALALGLGTAWLAGRVGRGMWPKPHSQMYLTAFHECLAWRTRSRAENGDGDAKWLRELTATMEEICRSSQSSDRVGATGMVD